MKGEQIFLVGLVLISLLVIYQKMNKLQKRVDASGAGAVEPERDIMPDLDAEE